MRITQKEQVTIPKEVGEKSGFLPHTRGDFIARINEVIIKKAAKTNRKSLSPLTAMIGRADTKVTTKQIMKLTRS